MQGKSTVEKVISREEKKLPPSESSMSVKDYLAKAKDAKNCKFD